MKSLFILSALIQLLFPIGFLGISPRHAVQELVKDLGGMICRFGGSLHASLFLLQDFSSYYSAALEIHFLTLEGSKSEAVCHPDVSCFLDYRVSLGRNRLRGVPFFQGLTLLSRFTDIENKLVVTVGN